MLFFLGQGRKTAFADGSKFVRSRSSVLIIKVWWTRGVHPKIKGLKWAFDLIFSSGQNDHLKRRIQRVKMTLCSFVIKCSFWALDFIGRFPPDDRLGNQWVKMTHWFWGGSLRPSPHYFWNQVSNLITWFLSALVSVLFWGGFLLFLLQ